MPFRDVRDFIARLEEEGEAQRIGEEVDWNLEAGAMLRRSNEQGLPAPFFEKIKGYPPGCRLLGGHLGSYKRVAIAVDMNPGTSRREIIEEFVRRKERLIKPVLVKDAPCKENIFTGDDVDLLKFPVPMVHEGDGGRYIGTFHATIFRDPDSDWVNWGMYRVMVHDKKTLGIRAVFHSHLGLLYYKKYEARNRPMEVAIAIGMEPVSTLYAGSPVPYGVSEVDVVGGIRGKPVELVKCETVDLSVPATSEIVIEGEIMPRERMDEGPFGEFPGYSVSGTEPRPVIHVKAVTHRNNPILTMSCVGVPIDDGHVIQSLTHEVDFLQVLRARGLPVSAVCVPLESANFMAVVTVKPPFANVADEIAHVIWGAKAGRATPYVIIVEDDVDPFDMAQVVHALATKCHPYRGICKLEHTAGLTLSPWLNPHERQFGMGAKAYFDCTWPLDWAPSDVPKKTSFQTAYPMEVQQSALAKWRNYGY